jgi:hypothetical protein
MVVVVVMKVTMSVENGGGSKLREGAWSADKLRGRSVSQVVISMP